MSNETKLPFKVDDRLEYETAELDEKGKPTRTSVKILAIGKDIGEIFVDNGNGFNCFFNITDVLNRINDGRFAVKVAS